MNRSVCSKAKSALAVIALLTALQLPLLNFQTPAFAQAPPAPSLSQGNFSAEYTKITKEIMLTGIAMERFSLNFRRETAHQPKFRKLRYFTTQEVGAGGLIAFEVISLKQFDKGRRRPLKINKNALKGATITAMTASIIAGSGSCLELASNLIRARRLHEQGYSSKTATKFVALKLRDLDQLLAKREALVAANTNDPAYERAAMEGKVLHAMRGSFANEYAHFNSDNATFKAAQNSFFVLNAAYNAVGAASAGVGYKAIEKPKLNGPANVLFIISGALAGVTPMLSSATAMVARKRADDILEKELGVMHFDQAAIATATKNLAGTLPAVDGSLMPSLPVSQRLAIYTEANALFIKQLESQTKTTRTLNKVALNSSLAAPVIGGLLMTQGILGTRGYYEYTFRPRKQIDLYYKGAVVGTVGTSLNAVSNAALLLASYGYERKLRKKEQLPEQLIAKRLAHLDDLETTINAL